MVVERRDLCDLFSLIGPVSVSYRVSLIFGAIAIADPLFLLYPQSSASAFELISKISMLNSDEVD
jgi:hypothetical protein